MEHLYFNFSSGAAGDMFLGALLELWPLEAQSQKLAELKVLLAMDDLELTHEKVLRSGISSTKVRVLIGGQEELPDFAGAHGHVHFSGLRERVKGTGFSSAIKEQGLALFWRMCEAEGLAHGVPPEKVALHEVGAADAFVDIFGVLWLVNQVGPASISGSPLNLGSGQVNCAHGAMAVPVPAVSELLAGIPVYSKGPAVELTTPTGALLASHLCDSFSAFPEMVLMGQGRGAGNRDFEQMANVLTCYRGTASELGLSQDEILWQLETQVDDATGKEVAATITGLLEAGAKDAWSTPIYMKKGRPGMLVSCLAEEPVLKQCEHIFFHELPTLGVRRFSVARTLCDRMEESFASSLGEIMVKWRRFKDGPWQPLSLDEDTMVRWAIQKNIAVKGIRQQLWRELNAQEKNN